jgi:hypothetical protein
MATAVHLKELLFSAHATLVSLPASTLHRVNLQQVLAIAGSIFTILLGIYSARQHLVTRLRTRHSHKHSFDLRDRFAMTILRGKVRDSEKSETLQRAVELQRPLLLGSSTESKELFTGTAPPSLTEEQGGRGWSVIDDVSLSVGQRVAEVHSWTPQMVAARVRSIGAAFAPYAAVMVENGVNGEMFAALDEADLVEELGVKKMHTKRLLQLVRGAAETGLGKVELVQVQEREQPGVAAAAAPEQKQEQEQGGGKAGEAALTASMLYPPG